MMNSNELQSNRRLDTESNDDQRGRVDVQGLLPVKEMKARLEISFR